MIQNDKTTCAKPSLNIILRDVEPGNPVSIEPSMRAFAERSHDLVIGVGFAQGPIMETVAKDYPNLHFAIIDGVIFEADGKTRSEERRVGKECRYGWGRYELKINREEVKSMRER